MPHILWGKHFLFVTNIIRLRFRDYTLRFQYLKGFISQSKRYLSMDTAYLRRRIEHLIHTDSSVFAKRIRGEGSSCMRCGWCCKENFKIRISEKIFRPSNAVSVFPGDIRRIVKKTGMEWHEVAEPDRYSCILCGNAVWAIGWILRRDEAQNCAFYSNNKCTIYMWRPVICRCYPFFMDERCSVDIMHCKKGNEELTENCAAEIGLVLKRYEIKKLQSYIRIIKQMEEKLELSNLHQLPENYSGKVFVCDGETVSSCRIDNGRFTCKY